jgi:peptidoglycan/LPS O-acetylase OafA/YrhL
LARSHLLVLDGLRGTAAICVVVFHLCQPAFGNDAPDAFWLRHAYLAVDFFFCLSGFVLGYAYDERYGRVSVAAFLRARLIRLHPMAVVGLLLGLLSYCLDPFSGSNPAHPWMQPQVAPAWKIVADATGGLLMLPAWPLPNRFGSLFSLNSPAWSLMWEYFASLTFALVLWRTPRTRLQVLVAVAAVAIGCSALHLNGLSAGYAWGGGQYGLARIIFSFGMGLWLFRSGYVIRSRLGFGALSLIMILLFVGPCSTQSAHNWGYDSVLVVVVLPLMVALGAGAHVSGWARRACELAGRVSYPLYVIHYAAVMVFANYCWTRAVRMRTLPWLIAGITLGLIVISYWALVFYDEPLRRWLGSRFHGQRGSGTVAHPVRNTRELFL